MSGAGDTWPRRSANVRLLVGALALAHCLAFTDRMVTALLAPAIKTALALSDFQLGLLQGAAFVISYSMASLVVGALADRHRRIGLVIVSLLISGLATASIGLARDFGDLFAARMVVGFGQAILSPAALSLLAQALPRDRLGRGISIYTAGSTLGRSLALVGGGALLAALPTAISSAWGPVYAWRLLCVGATVPNLVLASLLFVFIGEPTREPSRRVDRHRPTLLPWLLRQKRFYFTHTCLAAATILVIQTVTAWTTTLLARRHGLSIPAAGTIFGLIVLIAAPLGHLSGGALLDRLAPSFGRRTPGIAMATGLVAAVPMTALFGLAPNLVVSIGALTALTLVMGFTSPAGLVGIQARTPRRLRGHATAIFLICVTTFGFGLGPPALGLLTDHVFGANGIGMALFSVVMAAAAIGTTALLLQWPSGRRGGPSSDDRQASTLWREPSCPN